jgi:uncharacterized protein GlcG (DUF336 family)
LEGLTVNDVSAPDGLVPTTGATRRHLLAGLGGAGLLAAGLAATAPAPAAAQEAQSLTTQDLSLAQAQAVVQAAIAKATEMKVLMDIAVVDAGANLKAFARMDGAWLGSIDISIKKARTARFFNLPTGALGELSQPGGPLYQIEVSNGGLITFPGGVPLLASDGTIIGGIGVSGSSVEDDHAVASAGAAALGGPNLATPEATPGS